MAISHTAAVHVVPFIARLVLCGAFLPMGYMKLFDRAPVDAAQLARLEAMGWSLKPPAALNSDASRGAPSRSPGPAPEPAQSPSSAPAPKPLPTPAPAPAPASAPAESAAPPAKKDAKPAAPSGALAPVQGSSRIALASLGAQDGAAAPSGSSNSEIRSVRNCDLLAFAIADAGLPAPRATAWLVAIVEFLGGALILIGLFSRLSALGLAAVMAGAIYITSMAALREHPFIYGMPISDYQRFFLQASLGGLAIGVLLAGPGALSLDRVLFGRDAGPRRSPVRSGGGGGAS